MPGPRGARRQAAVEFLLLFPLIIGIILAVIELAMRQTRRVQFGESGQVAIIFAMTMLLIGLFAALVFDLGLTYDQRLRAQSAADFAALAGVQELPADPAAAVAIAREYLAANGFDPDADDVDTTIIAAYEGNQNQLFVSVERDFPRLFARGLGFMSANVGASGLADAGDNPNDIVVVIDRSGSMCGDSHSPSNCPPFPTVTTIERLDVGGAFSSSDFDDVLVTSLDYELDINVEPRNAGEWASFQSKPVRFDYEPRVDSLETIFDRVNASVEAGVTVTVDWSADTVTIARDIEGPAAITLADTYAHAVAIDPGADPPNGAPEFMTGNFLEAMKLIAADGALLGSMVLGGSTPLRAGPEDPSDDFWRPFGAVISSTIVFNRIFNPEFDQFALVSYDSGAVLDLALSTDFGTADPESFEPGSTFEQAVMDMAPGGATNIGHAIETARLELATNGRTATDKFIVLLTDGVPNRYPEGPAASRPCENDHGEVHDPSFSHDFTSSSSRGKCYAEDQARGAADDGYVLFTIGLGIGVDDDWLTELAAIGGGEYLPATDVTELEAAFQQVAQLIQIRLLR